MRDNFADDTVDLYDAHLCQPVIRRGRLRWLLFGLIVALVGIMGLAL